MTNFNFKPKFTKTGFGWHARGYLPHLDGGEMSHFVTFRLHDSLPQSVIEKWTADGAKDAALRKRIEKYLDAGAGACWLKDPEVAIIIRDAIIHFDGKRYRLAAWVIMPNHVHILMSLMPGHHLPDVLHSIKSFSAKGANKHLDRTGTFWMRESFDRYIRNYKRFAAVVRYIENNPVKAGLCERPEDWQFSSAHRK